MPSQLTPQIKARIAAEARETPPEGLAIECAWLSGYTQRMIDEIELDPTSKLARAAAGHQLEEIA